MDDINEETSPIAINEKTLEVEFFWRATVLLVATIFASEGYIKKAA